MKVEIKIERDGRKETLEIEVRDTATDREIDQDVAEYLLDIYNAEWERVYE